MLLSFANRHIKNLNKVFFSDSYFKDAEQENVKENSFIMTIAAYIHDPNILNYDVELNLPSCLSHLQMSAHLNA